jgi:hypothetical protein
MFSQGLISLAHGNRICMSWPPVVTQGFRWKFRDMGTAHHDLRSSLPYRVSHTMCSQCHAGHGTDTIETEKVSRIQALAEFAIQTFASRHPKVSLTNEHPRQ